MNVGVYGLPDSVRQNVLGFAVCVSNSGTAYRLSEQDGLTPMPEELFVGTLLRFKADLASTGPATLQIGTSAAASLVKRGNAVLIAGDIAAGQIVQVVFDGTNWQIISQLGQPVVKYVKFDGVTKPDNANTTVVANVATFTTAAVHGIAVGDRVNITGYVGTSVDFNVVSAVVSAVPSPTTFSYPIADTGNRVPAATGQVNTVIKAGNGVSSVTRSAVGVYVVNFTTSYVSPHYLVSVIGKGNTTFSSINASDAGVVGSKTIDLVVDTAEIHFRAEGL